LKEKEKSIPGRIKESMKAVPIKIERKELM
jgi:hypothetical protein